MRHPGPRLLLTALLAAGLLWTASTTRCEAPLARLKAAYTLNFAKFAEWPGSPGSRSLRVCVAGRSLVGEALEEAVPTQVAGRPLEVGYVRLPGDVSHCDLLFISELEPTRARRLLAALAEFPILTVSDLPGFARDGGMIELLVVKRRLRFEIDLDALRNAGLRLDPKLLQLARQVYGKSTRGDH